MRYLYLLRHANSEPLDERDDFDRQLTKQGQQAAVSMGKRLHDKSIKFDTILSSSAVRALTTAQLLVAQLKQVQPNLIEMVRIYHAVDTDLLDIAQGISNNFQHVMLVGHNPTITNTANRFTDDNLSNMSTCSLYAIEFNVDDWHAITFGSGKRLFFDCSK